jgi:hypothetical protein
LEETFTSLNFTRALAAQPPNQNMPEPSLEEMTAAAYARLQAPQDAESGPSDQVAQMYANIGHLEPVAKPGPDPSSATFEAFASVPEQGPLKRADELDAAKGNTAEAFAATPPRTLVPLFNPLTAPFKGMFSALTPSALEPGMFSLAQDVRPDDGSLMARLPTTETSATGLPGGAGSARGMWSGQLNGVEYVVGGWYDGSKIGIYYTTSYPAFSTATQSTGAAYSGNPSETGYTAGDNRLHDWGVPLSFCVATDPADGLDYLVIQDGHSAPRVFGTTPLNGSYIRTIIQYSAPVWATSTQVTASWPSSFNYVLAVNEAASQSLSTALSTQITTVTSYTVATPPVLTTAAAHGLADGDLVCIVGGTVSSGVITINGAFRAKVTGYSSTTFALYVDPTLGQAWDASGDGAYTGGSASLRSSCVLGNAGNVFIAFSGAANAGDGVILELNSALDLSASAQLIFSSNQAQYDPWDSLQVYIAPDSGGSPGTWTTVSDPTAVPWYAPVEVVWDGAMDFGNPNTEVLAGYPLGQLPASSLTAVKYIKLVWCGEEFTSTTPLSSPYGTELPSQATNVLTIHLITPSGATPAYSTSYLAAYAGAGGLSESPGVIYPAVSGDTEMQLMFGDDRFDGSTAFSGYVPYSSGIYYNHRITVQVPPLTDLQNGCDTINIYEAQFNGQSFGDYFFLFSDGGTGSKVGEFAGGAWVYAETGTTTPPTATTSYADEADQAAQNVSRYAPDSYATVMPVGTCMTAGNTRLFIGGSTFYALSEFEQQFRFRPALMVVNGQPIARSASTVTLSGESPVAFATPSGSSLNAQIIFFWTQRRTYAIGGFDGYSLSQPACQAEVGCSAPGSVSQYEDSIFWLDDNQQIRKFAYGRANLYGYQAYAYDLMPMLSRLVVDDRTQAISKTYLLWVSGCASFDRYYMSYTPAGDTANLRILVYDVTKRCFVEDTLAVGSQAFIKADLPAGRALIFQGADGNLYRHEDPTSTASHTINLTGPELHEKLWQRIAFYRTGLVVDAQTSAGSATVTKTLKPGLSDSSTIDLYTQPVNFSGLTSMWRWDSRSGSSQPGLMGLSCQTNISATVAPGTRIYSIVQEMLPTSLGQPGPDQL